MSKTAKTAIGGMATALTVALLIPTALDIFVFALPAFASLITAFCVIELDKKWAFGVYAASSVISLFTVPNKEAVLMYVAFFGYYPIVKALIEGKMKRPVGYVLKFLVFNVSVVAAYYVIIKLSGMPFNEFMGIEGGGFLAKYGVPVMLILGNIAFVLLDFMISVYVTRYLCSWQKRFKKLFKFK